MRIGIDGRVNYLFSMRPAVLISNLSVDKTKWPNGVPPSNWDSECVEFIRFVCFVKKSHKSERPTSCTFVSFTHIDQYTIHSPRETPMIRGRCIFIGESVWLLYSFPE